MKLSNDNASISNLNDAFASKDPDKDPKSTSVWSCFKSIIVSPRTSAKTLIGICGAAAGNTALAAGVALRILKKPKAHLQSINTLLQTLTTSFDQRSITGSKNSILDNDFLEKTKKNIDTCISELKTCEKKLPIGDQKNKINKALTSLHSAKTKLKDPSNLTDLYACFNELRPAKEIVQNLLGLSSSKDDDEVVSAGLLATSKLDYENLTGDELEIFRDSVAVNPTNTSPPPQAKEKVQKILFEACTKGDVTEFGILLNNLSRSGDPSNLQATNDQGDTLLHVACKKGHVDIATLLMAAETKLTTAKDKNGNTPLQIVHHQLSAIERDLNPENYMMNNSKPDKTTIAAYRKDFEEKIKQNPLYQNLCKIYELLSSSDPLENNQSRPKHPTGEAWLSNIDEYY